MDFFELTFEIFLGSIFLDSERRAKNNGRLRLTALLFAFWEIPVSLSRQCPQAKEL